MSVAKCLSYIEEARCLNVKVIKSNRRKRKEYAAGIKKIRNAYKLLFGDPKRRDNLRCRDTGVEIILKWDLSYISEDVDWTELAVDRNECPVLVNTATKAQRRKPTRCH